MGRNSMKCGRITAAVGVLPKRVHGSGLFQARGSPKVLSCASPRHRPSDAQEMGRLNPMGEKTYLHTTHFPPYSVGEKPGRCAPTARRESRPRALAEAGPDSRASAKEASPYVCGSSRSAISSNGSTSMGSVCGSTLALMDAGVPLKLP